MAGYRFLVAFVFSLISVSSTWSQEPGRVLPPPNDPFAPAKTPAPVTKVYSLCDLGDDPNLCKWIAETIPQMIQPGSWSMSEDKKNLSYYAPGKVMVICHTPAVHAQVEEFLQGLKKSVPVKQARHDAQVVPAQFAVPEPGRQVGPMGYPIPPVTPTPKHLFHYIIRYEGEGIIDSNVTKFAEALLKAAMASESKSSTPSGIVEAGATLPAAQYLSKPAAYGTSTPPTMPPADPQPAAPAAPRVVVPMLGPVPMANPPSGSNPSLPAGTQAKSSY